MPAVFITGTDTDAGKTLVTLGLMHSLQDQGLRVNGMKPVAAGVSEIDGNTVNEDAQLIYRQSSKVLPYELINPWLFEPAIAPHIAAQQANRKIDFQPIKAALNDKLGCINHARLTLQAIQAAGCRAIGWIGTQIDPQMMNVDENIKALKQYLPVQCLGIVPWLESRDAKTVASYINSETLMDELITTSMT